MIEVAGEAWGAMSEIIGKTMGRIARAVETIGAVREAIGATGEMGWDGCGAIGRTGETIGATGETIGRTGETIGGAGETTGRAGETIGRTGETIGRAGGRRLGG